MASKNGWPAVRGEREERERRSPRDWVPEQCVICPRRTRERRGTGYTQPTSVARMRGSKHRSSVVVPQVFNTILCVYTKREDSDRM